MSDYLSDICQVIKFLQLKAARLGYGLETEEAKHAWTREVGQGGNQPKKLIPRKIHRF